MRAKPTYLHKCGEKEDFFPSQFGKILLFSSPSHPCLLGCPRAHSLYYRFLADSAGLRSLGCRQILACMGYLKVRFIFSIITFFPPQGLQNPSFSSWSGSYNSSVKFRRRWGIDLKYFQFSCVWRMSISLVNWRPLYLGKDTSPISRGSGGTANHSLLQPPGHMTGTWPITQLHSPASNDWEDHRTQAGPIRAFHGGKVNRNAEKEVMFSLWVGGLSGSWSLALPGTVFPTSWKELPGG